MDPSLSKLFSFVLMVSMSCSAQVVQQLVVNGPAPSGSLPITFTHIQGARDISGGTGGTATSCHPSLGAAPAVGDIVFVAVFAFSSASSTPPGSFSVKDSTPNTYTATTHTPDSFTFGGTASYNYLYLYYFIATGTPSATINVTWTGGFNAACWADEFHKSTGSFGYDSDSAGAVNVCASSTANVPSITPGTSPALLYSIGADYENSLTAPAAGGSLGSWDGTAGGPDLTYTGGNTEYYPGASGATAVNYACTNGDHYAAIVGAVH